MARDGQGRTRREQTLDHIGSLADDAPKLIFISDPVSGKGYTVNTEDKTVTVQKRLDLEALLNSATARGEERGPSAAQSDGGREEKQGQSRHNRTQLQREDLGEKIIEGFNAKGERLLGQLPAGSVGNERPLELSLESWYSPDLYTFLYRKRIDPRFGEILYRLTNIRREEPAPALFRIPRGYRYLSASGRP